MDANNPRANYSPVSRNPQWSRRRPRPILDETSLKYLDEDDDEGDGPNDKTPNRDIKLEKHVHAHELAEHNESELKWARKELHEDLRRSPVFKQCRAETRHVISSSNPARALEPEPDYSNEDDEDDDESVGRAEQHSLEEVYLCSCCGVTRELDPAMKYMPLFKSLFALFNLLALLFGLANLAVGLWFRIDPKVYEIHHYIETQNFTYAGWILLAGGALSALVALVVGFSASSRQSVCMLVFYALVMVLLSILFIGTLALLTVYGLGSSLERFLTKEIYEQIRRRAMSAEPLMDLTLTSSDASQFLDFVQVKLRCCGAQDFRDYQKLGMVIPTTCFSIAGNFINAPGCGQALRELFDVRAGLAAGLTAASVIAQLLASLLAGLMVCSIYNYRASPRPASALSASMRSRSVGARGCGSPS